MPNTDFRLELTIACDNIKSYMSIIPATVGKNPLKKWSSPHGQQKSVRNSVLGCNLINDRMIFVHFQGKHTQRREEKEMVMCTHSQT